ncbi:branched-chain amino acid ABC transporter permease [Telluria mixta]|uniref:Branched-chain amino acid ABC transporter permease n=1 Tax=Telluria mixta TaxID=34071 RepID=A0ABT2BSX1_9BURK|nr:branched-chain amino acid ABC transporter permease [Telluria mixta]MCS0628215.1 branched-chain amino acid ABC transporter permease [Telluria mixta]WEM93671.1 branched-chain amino acid ABC transporter permease [Telluria mixta]
MKSTHFTVLRTSRGSQAALLGGCLIAAAAAAMPWWGESNWMREFNQIACYFIFASMWNLLAGYGGMVSIGQQAYLGFGGYAMLILANLFDVNPFLAVPIAAVLTALVAIPVSKLAFRLKGGYFAIGTWVIAEVFRISFSNVPAVGGGSGTSLTALAEIERGTRESVTFWITLAAVVATIGLTYFFLRSKQGLALMAIRDSETASASQGIDVGSVKLGVYLVAALGAGLAGALYFVGNLRISPDAAFSVNWSAFAIFLVMIGGLGTIEGPIVGAVIFWALNKFFSDYGTWYLVGLGLLAIVITLVFKQGLWGYLQKRFAFRVFPIQRRLEISGAHVPAAAAEPGPVKA